MKDSRIAWVGEIPKDWNSEKAKYHFQNTKYIPGSKSTEYERLALTLKGIIKREKEDANGLQPKDFDTYQLLRTNELVFKLIDLQNVSTSRVGLSPYTGLVSPAYIIIRASGSILPSFAEKYFLMLWHREIFNALGDNGVRSNLGSSDLLNIPICYPTKDEQHSISVFIDTECAEIDTLIADIQAQIETLEQYKRSVITEAVTKGLNPNIPLKDGGTDWIGQIPIHWSISKIKYEILPIERVVYETDGIITCFRNGEVTLRSNRREEGFTISLTENGYHGVDVGDLVIHGMDAFAGAIGCSDSRGKITPVVHVCRTTGNNRFFMYFLRTMAYGDILMDLSDGVRIRSSDYRNFSKLGKLSICVPPLDEQDKIVDYLDSKVKQIDDVIIQKQEQLEILEEYKKSVVFEYVTGKKEVPISCPQSAMKQ
ncbi:MAG: restriction endonuclease subunit S [Lachnospiraceae bacterium]|nr:restriction endonuclease subunit S [Lachnospiraceae bacterium]